ncbi:hypothetical protein [Roseibium limicola]|uniref:Uncharacterized protein n=1 Tax=Roseibium limicola TaxID=2816037 RepID=A0A939EML6_9HYPH|nr:hypothetical protein [Roseibium limicola]MBO0345505.1 hypothetical protein [Roseibium limicola]
MINDDLNDAAMEAEFAEDEDIRRAALSFISDAWAEAIANGVDADAVAHAAMFTALADLVATYGEDAVSKLAEGLPERIQRGDYTVNRVLQ